MTIDQIKQECHKAIELADKATEGPWIASDRGSSVRKPNGLSIRLQSPAGAAPEAWEAITRRLYADRDHIAHARTFAPAAARALLKSIDTLEMLLLLSNDYGVTSEVRDALSAICAQFEQS